MSRRSPALVHRPTRTIAASVTAVVLLAVGALSVLVGVRRLTEGTWPAPAIAFGDFLSATTWGSQVWIAITIGVAVLGLVLLIAAIKIGPPNAARLRSETDTGATSTELVISRRGLARLAGARAEHIDGVDSVAVHATTSRVQIAVTTPSTQTTQIETTVTEAVTAALTGAGLHPVPKVRTRASTKEI